MSLDLYINLWDKFNWKRVFKWYFG